jgi:2-keto-4-pentenoate hydratase
MTENIRTAATFLAQARRQHQVVDELPTECRPKSVPDAYTVQEALHSELIAQGHGTISGYKIGCTTPVMQAYLNIPHPCAGGIFSSTVYRSGATISRSEFVRIGLECEIAVRLGQDLSPQKGPFTVDNIAEAITAAMAAIELVDDRYRDSGTIGTPTLIADDFFGAGCVLGDEVAHVSPHTLLTSTATLRVDGQEVGSGQASAIMGNPLAALAWLANHQAERGTFLKTDDIVLLGSLVQVHWLGASEHAITIVNSALGTVTAHFP